MKRILKRDGTIVDFNEEKIVAAILKAGKSTGEFGETIAKELASKGKYDSLESVEEIQNEVEKVLMSSTYKATAKAYILYREQRSNLRLIDGYVSKKNWKIKENSNMGYSLQGLNNFIASSLSEKYWMNNIYPEYIRKSHENGDFWVHDTNSISSYCVGWDLKDLLMQGFTGASGKVESSPAKHFRSALGQIVNFFYTLQGEAAGAQAFSNIDTLLAPFIRFDNLSYKEVKQAIQEFIFNLNVPTRVGFQTPFTNLTLDLQPSGSLAEESVIVGGKRLDYSYKDFKKEAIMFNKAFLEVLKEGDAKGRVFTFPIPTYNITKDFDWDNEDLNPLWEATAKYGIPYFANFVSSDMSPEDSRSMCPLTGDTEALVKSPSESIEIWCMRDLSYLKGYKIKTLKGWEPFKANKQAKTKVIEVFCKNNSHICFGINHLQPVKEYGTIQAKDLKVGMNLPFNLEPDGKIEYSEILQINEIDYRDGDDSLYCIELDTEDHLFVLANGLVTHNCRLRLSLKDLNKRGGGLFGANPLTGSIGVVTINLPRLGYTSKSEFDFIKNLRVLMEKAKDSLEIKRKIIEELTENNLYPYTKFYLRDVYARYGKYWSNHFSTIGLIGMNEACLNLLGVGIDTEKGLDFSIKVLNYMRDTLQLFQEETGNLYNLEATPAEGTTYRLAKADKKKYPEIITSGKGEDVFYSNSTQLPVDYKADIFTIFDKQDKLQSLYTGGTVHHIFLGEAAPDPKAVKSLIKKLCENYTAPYFTLTPTFSICPTHGYIKGEVSKCEECGQETEIYSRVVGYLRPVKQWNAGKQAEFSMRTKQHM